MVEQVQETNSGEISKNITVKIDPYNEIFLSIIKSFVEAPDSATVSFEGGWVSDIVVEWRE